MLWLRLGGGVSDNIRSVAVGPESGTFRSFGVESDVDYESMRIRFDLAADLERRTYTTEAIEDETYGRGTLDFEIDAIPDRLIWLVRDQYSQGRVNPLEVTSPENRAGANEFVTGPRLELPLGPRNLLRLEALKGDRRVEETEALDSETETGTMSFVRALDNTAEFAINFISQGVEYESPSTAIDTASAYLSYRKTLATGEAYLAVGSTRSERGADSSTTPYVDLAWDRDIGARSRLEINAVQQYVDFFDDPLFGAGSDPLLVRDVYEEQLVSIRYLVESSRNRFSVERASSRARYTSITALDYDEASTSVSYWRTLTPQAELAVRYTLSERDFEAADRGDDIAIWHLSLDRELGRRFSLEAIYESRDDQAALGEAVEENILRLYLRYAVTNAATR